MNSYVNRREFLKGSMILAGGCMLTDFGLAGVKKKLTYSDQVDLGKTGLKISRLGIGVGSNSGSVQRALGTDGFNRLIRYAYDQGITYIDTADSYKTHTYVRDAIKGLPREKLFIQSKMGGNPEKPMETIDRFRKELAVDYIDSVLTHCTVTDNWNDERKRAMDALQEAKEKKIIRAHGVSCHSLPALQIAARIPWVDVNLVRINPQGAHIDTPVKHWNAKSDTSHLPAVMEQVKIMKKNGHGIIGMKLIGNGDFVKFEDRQKAMRYAMKCGLLDSCVIGFKSSQEIDEAIKNMNEALVLAAS